jgi:hypothetical protein
MRSCTMPHHDPIFIGDLARSLARLPGRLEFDREEAVRIATDIAERYLRGEFADEEVVAMAGDPPRFIPYVHTGEYRAGTINANLWYAAVALTPPAVRRYLERCGLAGAPRVLAEWFGLVQPQPAGDPPKRARRRDEKRPEIIAALPRLINSSEWKDAADKERCRAVERELDRPAGWCTPRTLSRAMAGYKKSGAR